MSKHTPGPWGWRVGRSPSCALVGGNGNVILEAVGVDGMELDDDLIAAAPDLLEALEYLLTNYAAMRYNESGKAMPDEAEIEARAAIAKATGEQP